MTTLAGARSSFRIGKDDAVESITVEQSGLPTIFCGPCVIESREHTLRHAEALAETARKIGLPFVFKSSFDKANRTSASGFRGLGVDEGLAVLDEVRRSLGVPVITDVHLPEQVSGVAEVVDVLQIPAFLCRQTDLLLAAAKASRPVFVKKGQFVAPDDMYYVAEKLVSAGCDSVLLCERGSSFGYRELIVDFRGLQIMSSFGCPVVLDATHSVQVMGGGGGSSSGNREFVPALVRAGVAVGVAGVFLEAHESPDQAPSDGPNMLPLAQVEAVFADIVALARLELSTRV